MFDIFTINIGDRLGFYQDLAGGEALTSVELASRTGTQEHYVREWLEQHTVTDILQVDDRGNQDMNEVIQKSSLDRPATYTIKVPGHLDDSWADWIGRMTITVESEGDGLPITTLVGMVDQAALQGLLRRLYSLGLPLISVNCIEVD